MFDFVRQTVRNKDRLFQKLRQVAPAAGAELTIANGEAAAQMVGHARAFAPVDKGDLRDSIVATPPGDTPPDHSQGVRTVPEGSWMVTAGNEKVRYPHFPEYGTAPHVNAGQFPGTQNPGIPRQPYFWPAYRIIRKGMRSRAAAAIRKAINKVASR